MISLLAFFDIAVAPSSSPTLPPWPWSTPDLSACVALPYSCSFRLPSFCWQPVEPLQLIVIWVFPFCSCNWFRVTLRTPWFWFCTYPALPFWCWRFRSSWFCWLPHRVLLCISCSVRSCTLKTGPMIPTRSLNPLPFSPCTEIQCGLICSLNFECILDHLFGHMLLSSSPAIYPLASQSSKLPPKWCPSCLYRCEKGISVIRCWGCFWRRLTKEQRQTECESTDEHWGSRGRDWHRFSSPARNRWQAIVEVC